MINIDQNLDENQMKFERNSGGMIRIKWNVIEEYAEPYEDSADVKDRIDHDLKKRIQNAESRCKLNILGLEYSF